MKLKIINLFCWHILFYFLFYELRVSIEVQNFEQLAEWFELKGGLLNLSSILVFFGYPLGTYIVLYRYYPKSIFKVLIGVIVVFFLVVCSRYLIEEVLYLRLFGFDNFYDEMSPSVYALRNMFYGVLHIIFGFTFFLIQYSTFQEKQTQTLLTENKKTELEFLRSQMNPHFLFNTLNNIYSLVYQRSDKALPTLEKLTAILRYSLYQGDNKIPLEKEINIIDDFILLEKMRYDFPLNLDFKINGSLKNVMIPPFLLLPIVENAFKHGDMRLPFKIILDTTEGQLSFSVKNNIGVKQKDKVGGIGLENIKKRLELIYGENHKLNINQSSSVFYVFLKL